MKPDKRHDAYYMLLDKNKHKIFITFDNITDALLELNKTPEAKHIVMIDETIIWDKE